MVRSCKNPRTKQPHKNPNEIHKFTNSQIYKQLEGCQKAFDLLTEYYGVRRMRVVLNGRKVGNGDDACYLENKAYFTKRGLKKRTVLHELYHHLAYTKGMEKPERIEEKSANCYAREFLSR